MVLANRRWQLSCCWVCRAPPKLRPPIPTPAVMKPYLRLVAVGRRTQVLHGTKRHLLAALRKRQQELACGGAQCAHRNREGAGEEAHYRRSATCNAARTNSLPLAGGSCSLGCSAAGWRWVIIFGPNLANFCWLRRTSEPDRELRPLGKLGTPDCLNGS